MVFSFFKKDPKDNAGRGKDGSRSSSAGASSARPSTKPLVKPVGKPLGKPQQDGRGGAINSRFATTGNALPNRDLARSLAKETAAKIDAIENEMARDFMRPAANTGNPAAGSSPGVRVPTSSPRSAVVQKQPKPVAAAAVDDLDDDSAIHLVGRNDSLAHFARCPFLRLCCFRHVIHSPASAAAISR